MSAKSKISRRDFLRWGGAGVGAAAIAAFTFRKKIISGLFPTFQVPLGHRLWDKNFPAPTIFRETDVAILGGGMSGLTAAWQFTKTSPHLRWELYELESAVGGNAQSGENSVSAYPWGAHYVPFVNEETTHVREIFEDLGIIVGTQNGLPLYNEDYVCNDPEERLLLRGQWNEGIVPSQGILQEEASELRRFFAYLHELKQRRGGDGKLLFTFPLDHGSRDEKVLALDRISFAAHLDSLGYRGEPLRWYVDYCCKDDFGALAKDVSAWAGLHYFCARRGKAANGAGSSLVTWPEGNGWIVKALRKRLRGDVYSSSLVYDVANTDRGVTVKVFDPAKNASIEIKARAAVLATPLHVGHRIFSDVAPLWDEYNEKFRHSPWLIANVTLKRRPVGAGFPLAWDNVSYYAKSIGYVVATHQNSRGADSPTVLTLYYPFVEELGTFERYRLLMMSEEKLKDVAMSELRHMHPTIDEDLVDLKVKLWGHGMIRPSTDFIWSGAREKFARRFGNVLLAHTDLSGISVFEEASYHGTRVAKEIASWLA